MPQPSQLAESLSVSTHWFEQHVPVLPEASGHRVPELAGPQVGMAAHWPDRQNIPVEQALPQTPQLAGSSLVSTHALPQHCAVPPALPGLEHGSIGSLALQVWVTQLLETQESPAGQLLPL
jgi:hypothetical protein